MEVNSETLLAIVVLWVAFDLICRVWNWAKKPKPVQAPPLVLPDEYWQKLKQMIDSGCLDAMIAIQEAQAFTETVPAPPVTVAPPGNNGHSDDDIEAATALYHASRHVNKQAEERAPEPAAVTEPAHVPVKSRHTDPPLEKKRGRGRPFGSKKKGNGLDADS